MSGAGFAAVVPERTLKSLHFSEAVYVEETFAANTGQFSEFSIGNAGTFALSGGAGVITLATGAQRSRFVRVAGTALDGPVGWVQCDITARTGNPATFNVCLVGFAKDSTNYVYADHNITAGQTRLNYNFNGVSGVIAFTNTLTAPFQLALSIYKNRLTVYFDDSSVENWSTAVSFEVPVSSVDLTAFDFTGWLPSFGANMSSNDNVTWTFDNLKAYPNRIDYCEFAPANLTLYSDGFTADNTTVTGTSAATPSISSNRYQLADAGSGTTFAIFGSQAEMLMPQLFAEVDVVSQSTLVGRCGVGVAKDSTHYIYARYSRVDTNYAIIVNTGSGEVVLGTTAYAGTHNPPFKIALSVVGPIAVMWIDEGAGWVAAASANVTASFDTLSLLKSGGGYKPALYMSNTGACTFIFDNFRIGRFGTTGIRDMVLATEEDGTPIQVSGQWLFTATLNDSKGGGNCGVFTIDPDTRYVTQVGVIMVDRSSKVYNDLDCHLIRDASNDWRIMIASWGNGFGGSLEVQHKLETSLDLSTGSNVVSGLTNLQFPGYGVGSSGRYHATAVKIAGVWYVPFDETTSTSFGGNTFNIRLCTTTDFSTFTDVANDQANRDYEGSHFNILDGLRWYVTGGPTVARCYDSSLTFLNNLDAPGAFVGGSDTFPHPVIFAKDAETQVLMTFDKTRFSGGSFSWGNLRLFEAPRYK